MAPAFRGVLGAEYEACSLVNREVMSTPRRSFFSTDCEKQVGASLVPKIR